MTLALWRVSILSDGSRNQVVQEIARRQSRLRGFARCLLVRFSDVDDMLQEIHAVLWEKANEFQPGTNFWAWANRIARFKVLNHFRKLGRERLVFDEPILEELAEIATRKLEQLDQRRAALDHCLQQLPPPERRLIDSRYAAGHTIELISESIDRPAGSVRQALDRIRATLQACIKRQLAMGGERS
jgi:RNA polymerase sigma-70 factor (ECF subfamily)